MSREREAKNFIKRNLMSAVKETRSVHHKKLADYEKPLPEKPVNYGRVP